MSDKFDPYYTLLGIARRPRPLTFYQLLGVELFESDSAVIAAAVDQRREQLRQAESGPHREFTPKLRKQVEAAWRCLADEVARNKYNVQVKARLAKSSATSPAKPSARENSSPSRRPAKAQTLSTQSKPQTDTPQQLPQVSPHVGNRFSRRTKRKKSSQKNRMAIGGVILATVCLLAVFFVVRTLVPSQDLAAGAKSDSTAGEQSSNTNQTPPDAATIATTVPAKDDAVESVDSRELNQPTADPSSNESSSNEPTSNESPPIKPTPESTEPPLAVVDTDAPSATPAALKNISENIGHFVDQHCIRCHGPGKEEGGLRLDQLTADLDDLESVEHYQNMLDEITVSSMPPEDEPQPDGAAVTEVIEALTSHVEAAKRRHEAGGGKPVRRMAKIEYANTVYDLMGVHIDSESLQNDGGIGAFDTQADTLYTTDMYFETYLEVARDAVQRFIASRDEKPGQRELNPTRKTSAASKKARKSFNLVGQSVPPAGHLIATIACWRDTPQSRQPIFTSTVAGESREVLGTQNKPHFIERIFTAPKDESWSRPEGMGLGEIKLTQVINPQPYSFFEKYRNKFERRGSMPDSAAKPIIGQFAKLMSRGRKVDPKLISGLNRLFLLGRKQGEPFWEAIVEPMALSMCTVEAMMHFEDREHQNISGTVSPIDLACRLSYFLWRSAPDSELIELAQSGKLNEPTIRSQQIERMMSDEKFDRFLRDFSNQWLELDRQDAIAVDDRLFRNFDVATKRSMKEETIQFMSHVISEDLSLTNLIDSDFALINNAMASHYGMPRIKGDEFRRVELAAKDRRGGILTQAGILMQTGTGERSSIVERGVFIAKKLMNAEPPPPPPLVDDLPTDGQDFVKMTGAELVRKHARSPQCASCHKKIDPMGVGLEEFDAVGLYRTQDVRMIPNYDKLSKRAKRNLKSPTFAVPLETKGALVTGQRFQGAQELKKALLRNKKRLAKSYVEGLLTFANGRKSNVTDQAIVDDIVKQAAKADYRAQSIVRAVVESSAFTSN